MSTGNVSLACYGCVDFANNERTFAYYRWACANNMFPAGCKPDIRDLCMCAADAPLTPFVDPITDGVCWYDPSVPESSHFLGIIVLNRPYESATFSRDTSDGFIEGSILNRPKILGKSFVFEALILATSSEGKNYGEEWLKSLLRDSPCTSSENDCESCFGKRMGMRKFCPDIESTDDGIHEWFGVGLTEDVTSTDDASTRQACCDILYPITFTLQSSSPYSFSSTEFAVCEKPVDPDDYVRCYDWTQDCLECCEAVECDRCKYDPVCTCFPFIIPEPALPRDNACDICTPLAKIYECCGTGELPATYDSTFKIEIFSGYDVNNQAFLDSGMRDFTFKIYENPKDFPCITDDDSYALWCNENPCTEFAVNYIPYNSTLVIDGRTQKVTLNCNGSCASFQHKIASTVGELFPLLSKCTPMMFSSEFSYYTSQLLDGAPGVSPSSIKITRYLRFKD